jgi:hypothetical protein
MRKLLAFTTFIFLITLTSATCNKNDELTQSGNVGTLTLTTNTGKKFTASFKNYGPPTSYGGFVIDRNIIWFDSFQDPNGAYSTTYISAIFDDRNKIYLFTYFKTSAPVLNNMYSGYPDPNNFRWALDGRDIFCNNPDIIFEEYSNSGRIKGRARGTEFNGTLAYTVDFDFIIK